MLHRLFLNFNLKDSDIRVSVIKLIHHIRIGRALFMYLHCFHKEINVLDQICGITLTFIIYTVRS